MSIALTPATIQATSKGLLTIRTTLIGPPPGPLVVTAVALAQGVPLPWITSPPVPVPAEAGAGAPLTIPLAFYSADPDAPARVSSDGVELQVGPPAGPPLLRHPIAYIREWSRDLPALRPADLAALPFSAAPQSSGALRAAYDGDEQGGLLIARPRAGGLVALVVQPGTACIVLRWYVYGPPGAGAGGPVPAQPGYAVPPGGFVDLAAGRVVADAAAADAVWEPESPGAAAMQLRPLAGATLAPLRTPIQLALAATRIFASGNPRSGTSRDWDEVRDLFDNCNETPARANFCVDTIWAPAAIEFRIIVRRDIRIPDNWAHELPATALRAFSGEHNLPGVLNVYFLRSVEGARAWGAADRNPGAGGQQGALWVGDRCGPPPTPDCWVEDVITVAHEAGHFLSLAHLCDDTGPAPPCGPGADQYLMYGDGTTPDSRRLTDDEIFHARQRAWYYRP